MENQHLLSQDNLCPEKSTSDRKFVIFDLDGTLIDSFECVLRCVNKTLDYYSLPRLKITKTTECRDIAIIFEHAKKVIYENVNFREFKKCFDNIHLSDCIESVKIRQHMFSELKRYYNNGVNVIILTNKFQPIAEKICKVFLEQFDLIVIGRNASGDTISKESQLRNFLANAGLNLNQILYYYGDSETDKNTADSLKIRFFYA